MPREERLHVAQGIYSVRLVTNLGTRLFSSLQDQQEFERLLKSALEKGGARLHAYAWLQDLAHLAIQVDQRPLGRIVQQAAGSYSRYINRCRGRRGHFFGRVYHATLLPRIEYLPELVRHVHLTPVRAGLVADPVDYPASSHRAYLGQVVTPWLTTQLMLEVLKERGWEGRRGYEQFIALGEGQQVAHTSRYRRGESLHVMDDDAFLRWLRDPQKGRPSLEQIIHAVCSKLRVDPGELHTTSPRPALPMARALVTWYATTGAGIALATVARRLHRHPSTLYVGCKRQRAVRPTLFEEPLEQLLQGEQR